MALESKTEIEPYENTLTIDELRRELRYALDVQYGILHALRDLPRFPSPFILKALDSASKYPEDSERGKRLQREFGLKVIPPVSECEGGAGLWDRIRSGLSAPSGEWQWAPKDPTQRMWIAGAFAHNADPQPLDRCITCGEAETIYRAMLAACLTNDSPKVAKPQ